MDQSLATSKFYITGAETGLGKAIADKYGNVDHIEDCDIFINNRHDGFDQVRLLYKAVDLNKTVVNIGSVASDWIYGYDETFKYGIEKKLLRDVNSQLYWQGANTSIINFGWFDTYRSKDYTGEKMTVEYCVSVVEWILLQPYRVKEISVAPRYEKPNHYK